MDYAGAYRDGYERYRALVSGRPAGELATTVPTCPGWTIKDLTAHLVGLAADALRGNYPDFSAGVAEDATALAGQEAWTDAQVRSRKDASVEELLDEWAGLIDPLVEIMAPGALPEGYPYYIEMGPAFDLSVHLHDARHALSAPGDRDALITRTGADGYVVWLAMRLAGAGMPCLGLVLDGEERVLGAGEPQAVLSGTTFEVFRAISGRRSLDQVRAMAWQGDPEPFLPHLSPLPYSETAVVEG